MRLQKVSSFQNTTSYNRTASNRQSSNVFAASLQAASASRIITEKKDGYIRRYRLLSDGRRELLSEERDESFEQLPKRNHNLDLLNEMNYKK